MLSFNVKGLNNPKRKTIWNDALKYGSDIICLQELHFARDNPPKFSHHKFPHIFFTNNRKKKKGVVMIIRDSISFQLLNFKTDSQGCYIILVAKVENSILTIVNVYAPNKNPQQYLKMILRTVKKIQKGNAIIFGDLNAPMVSLMVTSKGSHSTRKFETYISTRRPS